MPADKQTAADERISDNTPEARHDNATANEQQPQPTPNEANEQATTQEDQAPSSNAETTATDAITSPARAQLPQLPPLKVALGLGTRTKQGLQGNDVSVCGKVAMGLDPYERVPL
ncbi:MAG: hypothetical protein Q9219_001800 [cf. Caloplaca sp. 3 TL-2023]